MAHKYSEEDILELMAMFSIRMCEEELSDEKAKEGRGLKEPLESPVAVFISERVSMSPRLYSDSRSHLLR